MRGVTECTKYRAVVTHCLEVVERLAMDDHIPLHWLRKYLTGAQTLSTQAARDGTSHSVGASDTA
jgi:hypothetical protein